MGTLRNEDDPHGDVWSRGMVFSALRESGDWIKSPIGSVEVCLKYYFHVVLVPSHQRTVCSASDNPVFRPSRAWFCRSSC